MLLLLACPNCLNAIEREKRELQVPATCRDCGALLGLSYDRKPHLVLVCRSYGRVFEGVEGQIAPGVRPLCPKLPYAARLAGEVRAAHLDRFASRPRLPAHVLC